MTGQSARLYLERKGRIDTRRTHFGSVLDVGSTAVSHVATLINPTIQLINDDFGTPDKSGVSEIWPDKEKFNVT